VTSSVSVTEVRNALRCPRLFALGRQRAAALGFPVGSSCLGAAFHRIVDRFAQNAQSPLRPLADLAAGAAFDEVAAALRRLLLDLLVRELAANPSYATMPAEVDDLAEALRELARHLAGRMRRFAERPAVALGRVVLAGERELEARLEPDGPLVRGRIDALYGDAAGEREVVEYKLTDEANDALDRAQVALYRELLLRAEGIKAKPVVLRFLPSLRETTIDGATADGLVVAVLRPLLGNMLRWLQAPETAPPTERLDLCAACPLRDECVRTYPVRLSTRDDPPAAASRVGAIPLPETLPAPAPQPPEPAAEDALGLAEAERFRDRILAELGREGVHAVCPRPPVVGPTLIQIEISRPRGRVSQLDRAAEDVVHRLATSDDIESSYESSGGHRLFVLRRPAPRVVELGPLLAQKRGWLAARPGRYLVGQCPDGAILGGDFADPGTPHLLVAGQAGSGKSCLLLSLVASLVQNHGPERIRLTLLDPKRVTFNVPFFLAAVSAHLDAPIGYDIEDALPILERLAETMEDRYQLFERARVRDIDEHNEQASAGERLERKILVLDEFQDLTAERATAKQFFGLVQRLGAKARAAGIHIVLATQRPDRDTVPSIIKANLGGKLALKVASGVNSKIILDCGGAEKLYGKGDLLADLGQGLVRAQAPLMQ
jgi:S-DNA-T family DNA segregation ATPase FtsK/SpoIIIE